MMSRATAVVVMACLVAAPATARSVRQQADGRVQGPDTADQGVSARGFRYSLPATVAKVRLQLELVSCSSGPQAVPTVTITPVGGSSDATFAFDTPPSRWFSRRNVEVALHENGTIKSINAGAADRTLDVAVTALKVVIGLAGLKFFDPTRRAPPAGATCNDDTIAALGQVAVLQARIAALRADLFGDTPSAPAKDLQERVNLAAAELVRIKTERLTMTLEKNVVFGTEEGTLRWQGSGLSRWLSGDIAPADNLFALNWRAESAGSTTPTLTSSDELTALAERCTTDCLLMPTPHPVRLSITTEPNRNLVSAPNVALSDLQLATSTMPVAQWGQWRELRLAPRFGEQLTSGASFDAFGRQLTFVATSEVRAQAFATAAQTAVTDYSAWRTAEQASEINDLRAETAELQARQLRNQLRYCEAVIAAGGFVCPTAPTAPPATP